MPSVEMRPFDNLEEAKEYLWAKITSDKFIYGI